MRFGELFEFHKIPEWYNMYLNYGLLKQNIENFQKLEKAKEMMKLPGYYIRSDVSGEIVALDMNFLKPN